jgi:hypothetical protein
MSDAWVESFSKTYKRKYWFNSLTNASSWTEPINLNKNTISSCSSSSKSKNNSENNDYGDSESNKKKSKIESSSNSFNTTSNHLLFNEIAIDFPFLSIERERLRELCHTSFVKEMSKYVIQGSSKTARACSKDGMKIGLQGLFGRILWTQLLNQVMKLGDVDSILRDSVFPRSFIRDEAVEIELMEFGRTREQINEIMEVLATNLISAGDTAIKIRNNASTYSDSFVIICNDSNSSSKQLITSATVNCDNIYKLSFKHINHFISGAHLLKLLRLYRLHTDSSIDIDDKNFVSFLFF